MKSNYCEQARGLLVMLSTILIVFITLGGVFINQGLVVNVRQELAQYEEVQPDEEVQPELEVEKSPEYQPEKPEVEPEGYVPFEEIGVES